jgi:hypothetical protein
MKKPRTRVTPTRAPDDKEVHISTIDSGVSYFIQIQERARLNVIRAGRLCVPRPPTAPGRFVRVMRTRDPGSVPKNIVGVSRIPIRSLRVSVTCLVLNIA